MGKFGDEDHCLKMRRNGAFGCCHSCEADENSIDCKGRIGVPGDDDVHRCLEFLVSGGDSGFTVGGFEVFPCYGSEHRVDVSILLDGLFEKVQDSVTNADNHSGCHTVMS